MATDPNAHPRSACLAALFVGVVARLAPGAGAADPVSLKNPSFENDRFTEKHGYAAANGGNIDGWQSRGGVGINPTWRDPAKQTGPQNSFADNGRIPHGKQVLFMQNKATVSQIIQGLKQGKKYRVTFRENGRAVQHSKEPPVLTVTLGEKTVVSPHEVPAVDRGNQHVMPYARVESDCFAPPEDGEYALEFRTTREGGTSVLIDHVTIEEVE